MAHYFVYLLKIKKGKLVMRECGVRVVVVGDPGVGKTQLVNRFINNTFNQVNWDGWLNQLNNRVFQENGIFFTMYCFYSP